MHILSILLFALSSSSDNLVVGFSYGAKKVRVNLSSNIMVSLISGIGTFLSMLFGKLLLKVLPDVHESLIGSSILILFGLYLLINSIKSSSKKSDLNLNKENISEFQRYEDALKNPDILDSNHSKTIETKEAVIMGIVLCLNNVGLGIGASITGLNIYITSIFSLVFSFIFIPLGYHIGEKVLSDRLSKYSELISAAIVIALGIYEFFV